MAVFLLMGCQTTDTLPKDTTSPTAVKEADQELAEESQIQQVLPRKDGKLDMPLSEAVVSHKPVLCGPSEVFMKGIEKTSQEKPIGFWIDSQYGHKIFLLHNGETGTVTILEYPRPNVACFLSVGINSKFKLELQSQGTAISHKRVLTLH